LVVAALLYGVVNAVVRPLLVILTLPITVLTLGLFLLVINAATLGLVAWMLDNFTIAGFWPALLGAVVVSVTGWLASYFIGPRGRVEVIVVRHRR
jgi:putative membrane protein